MLLIIAKATIVIQDIYLLPLFGQMFFISATGDLICMEKYSPHPKVVRWCNIEVYVSQNSIYGGATNSNWGFGILSHIPV